MFKPILNGLGSSKCNCAPAAGRSCTPCIFTLQGCRFLHSGGCGILLAGHSHEMHDVVDASSHDAMTAYASPKVPRKNRIHDLSNEDVNVTNQNFEQ